MSEKVQPWKAAWPPVNSEATTEARTASAAEYGIEKGGIVVVDGTAANVKPAAPLKSQPWKASWPPAAAPRASGPAPGDIEYGIAQGATAVVDGTAANVKPARKTVRVGSLTA